MEDIYFLVTVKLILTMWYFLAGYFKNDGQATKPTELTKLPKDIF